MFVQLAVKLVPKDYDINVTSKTYSDSVFDEFGDSPAPDERAPGNASGCGLRIGHFLIG